MDHLSENISEAFFRRFVHLRRMRKHHENVTRTFPGALLAKRISDEFQHEGSFKLEMYRIRRNLCGEEVLGMFSEGCKMVSIEFNGQRSVVCLI